MEDLATIDSKIIIDAISDHIGQLASLTNWLIPIFLLLILQVSRPGKKIKILALEFSRQTVALLSRFIVSIYSIGALTIILRLCSLFNQLKPNDATTAFYVLTTNKWLLNPFAFFGGGFSTVISLISLSGMIFVYVNSFDQSLLYQRNPFPVFRKSASLRSSSERLAARLQNFNLLCGNIILLAILALFLSVEHKVKGEYPELSSAIFSFLLLWIPVCIGSVIAAAYIDLKILDIITYKKPKLYILSSAMDFEIANFLSQKFDELGHKTEQIQFPSVLRVLKFLAEAKIYQSQSSFSSVLDASNKDSFEEAREEKSRQRLTDFLEEKLEVHDWLIVVKSKNFSDDYTGIISRYLQKHQNYLPPFYVNGDELNDLKALPVRAKLRDRCIAFSRSIKVLISYDAEDDVVAQRISSALQDKGYQITLDKGYTVGDSDSWEEEISSKRASLKSGLMIVLISTKSLQSGWILYGLELAKDNNTRVIVCNFLPETKSFPSSLSDLPQIEFSRNFKDGISLLLQLLNK